MINTLQEFVDILIFMNHDTMALQDGGDGAIVLNMEDHEEIPKAVVKPP